MAKLASTQIEQLREIGAYLRQVRQQQGRGLDDIANQIFIRPALLRAVEEGQDQQLPEPVFIQGFIRRYAEALGLNGGELSKEFSVTATPAVSEPYSNGNGSANGHAEVEMRQPIQENRQSLQETRQPIQFPHEPPVPERGLNRRQSGLPLGLAAGLLVLAAGAALGIWSLANRPNQASVANSSQPSTAAPETAAPEAAAPEPVPVPTPEATPEPTSNAPVVADLSLRDRAWISVVADGQKVYEGILESGAEETYEAQTSLRITSGNAGGVALSFNGNTPVSMGASGTVKTLTLTPETDPASLAVP
ncbi:MAG: DUF4115 domain-containing protein [Cyanobacteria bacterium Co-bin13]|nr:DUF4115 domain-containing protein [Cyanobacteria bacterium Co-bin13]